MNRSIVFGIVIILFSRSAIGDPVSYRFDMPPFNLRGMIGVESTLEVTVDNGSSSWTNQSYTNADIVAVTVTIGSDSVSFNAAEDIRSVSDELAVYIVSDGAGRGTLTLNAAFDTSITFQTGLAVDGLVQLGTNDGSGPSNYAVQLPGLQSVRSISFGDIVVVGSIGSGTTNQCSTPVQCAREAVSAPYNWGREGWDIDSGEWVEPLDLIQSAYADNSGSGPGVDCSGLVEWSSGLSQSTGYVRRIAQQLCNDRHSVTVSADSRQPGDLMCFDYCGPGEVCTPREGVVDHVALYAGEAGPGAETFIEAVVGFGPAEVKEIPLNEVFASASRRTAFNGTGALPCQDCGYRRLRETPIPPEFQVISQSPITLRLVDPDGISIDRATIFRTHEEEAIAVPGVLYYSFVDGIHDMIYAPEVKEGAYFIDVLPKDDALPNDVYSLKSVFDGAETVLAQEVPVGEIPLEGYGIEISGGELRTFTPLSIDVLPGSSEDQINVRSRGVIAVAVLSSATFSASSIEPTSLRFGPGGATEKHGKLHFEDVNGDGLTDVILHFGTQDTALGLGLSKLELRGIAEDGQLVRGEATVYGR